MVNKKIAKIIVLIAIQCFILPGIILADEIYMKNEDRISGNIIEEGPDKVSIETEAMGTISVNRDFVERIVKGDEGKSVDSKSLEAVEWRRELSLGYSKASGNTRNSQGSVQVDINRRTEHNEATAKADIYYSSSNKKMDTQKWFGLARYAFSFWERKWYNFYKLEADHDRFANIDYRLVPSVGIGYWFLDKEDLRVMVEFGLGLEHTNYRDAAKDEDEAVMVPRAFLEKRLFGSSKISQDLTLYSSLEDAQNYRLHSETVFINPINGSLSLSLSLINDYNSNPPQDTKKNDISLISALIYSF